MNYMKARLIIEEAITTGVTPFDHPAIPNLRTILTNDPLGSLRVTYAVNSISPNGTPTEKEYRLITQTGTRLVIPGDQLTSLPSKVRTQFVVMEFRLKNWRPVL